MILYRYGWCASSNSEPTGGGDSKPLLGRRRIWEENIVPIGFVRIPVGEAYHEAEFVAEEGANEISGAEREAADGIDVVLRNLLQHRASSSLENSDR